MALPRYALIVEDNAKVMLNTLEILDEQGFDVFASMDTDDALRRLQVYGDELKLLFTNVELPGSIDGFKLARSAATRWPALPIIVASGRRSAGPGDMPDGAVFLPKPYGRTEVLDTLVYFKSIEPA